LICSTTRCSLAECPIWDGERLLYLDLLDPAIIECFPDRREVRHDLPLPAPLGGLCLLSDHGMVVCCREGLFRVDPASLRLESRLAAPDSSFSVAPPNDAAVHPSGCLFIATADAAENAPTAGVFLLSLGHGLKRLVSGYTVGNGPSFSPDGGMAYIADSPKGEIYCYEWNGERAALENRRLFASGGRTPGLPDGVAVDSEGGVWNARWGGGLVVRYAPDGRESDRVEVPAKLVTSCAFGGPKLRTLYVTTARAKEAGADLGGHVFAFEVGKTGLPASRAVI